jgi:hypothetical protein
MPVSIMSPDVHTAFDQSRSPQIRRVAVGKNTVYIPTPFSSPEDWRHQWIYFLLIDRFNSSQFSGVREQWTGCHAPRETSPVRAPSRCDRNVTEW